MEECIHGLDAPLCDACTPKAPPSPEAIAAAAKPRKAAAPRARSRAAARTAVRQPAITVGDQRIYHLTHVSNLARIIQTGELRASACGAEPTTDIASPQARAQRAATVIDETDVVAQYVPFFVSPDATLWATIRAGKPDPRLADDASDYPANEFVMLLSTAGAADREHSGICRTDAAFPGATVVTDPEQVNRELYRLHEDEDALREAEFLVREQFPFTSVTTIGVASDRIRGEVKALLDGAAHKPKVAVYPPWFMRG